MAFRNPLLLLESVHTHPTRMPILRHGMGRHSCRSATRLVIERARYPTLIWREAREVYFSTVFVLKICVQKAGRDLYPTPPELHGGSSRIVRSSSCKSRNELSGLANPAIELAWNMLVEHAQSFFISSRDCLASEREVPQHKVQLAP